MKAIRQTSYREYLRDYFEAEKANRRAASLKEFATKLGLTESSLRMILAGKRNLTVRNIHLIAKGLKLARAQTEFFEALVLRDQAETDAEKKYYSRRLKETSSRYALTELAINESSALKDWFGPALLLYLRENRITQNELSVHFQTQLAQRLGISAEKIRETIELFDRQGLLAPASPGKEHLSFCRLSSVRAQVAHIKNCLAFITRRIDEDYRSGRSLFAVNNISMSEDQVQDLAREYKALIEKYMNADSDSENRAILQVAFAAVKVL